MSNYEKELVEKAIKVFHKSLEVSDNFHEAGDVLLVAVDMFLEQFNQDYDENSTSLLTELNERQMYFERTVKQSIDKNSLN